MITRLKGLNKLDRHLSQLCWRKACLSWLASRASNRGSCNAPGSILEVRNLEARNWPCRFPMFDPTLCIQTQSSRMDLRGGGRTGKTTSMFSFKLSFQLCPISCRNLRKIINFNLANRIDSLESVANNRRWSCFFKKNSFRKLLS